MRRIGRLLELSKQIISIVDFTIHIEIATIAALNRKTALNAAESEYPLAFSAMSFV